mgnify:CR=1 FL=1
MKPIRLLQNMQHCKRYPSKRYLYGSKMLQPVSEQRLLKFPLLLRQYVDVRSVNGRISYLQMQSIRRNMQPSKGYLQLLLPLLNLHLPHTVMPLLQSLHHHRYKNRSSYLLLLRVRLHHRMVHAVQRMQ